MGPSEIEVESQLWNVLLSLGIMPETMVNNLMQKQRGIVRQGWKLDQVYCQERERQEKMRYTLETRVPRSSENENDPPK